MSFQFNKNLGQNFLTDNNLLRAIVADAGITKADSVLEIGAGAGALTYELCAAAGRVVAYEIDLRLKDILAEKLADFDNYELRFADYLKEKSPPASNKVCANLPYYITAPVIFNLIEGQHPPEVIVIMVQEEVAHRLCAAPGTKDYGAMTASVKLAYKPEITRKVNRAMFVPRPNVDSAVVRLIRLDCPYDLPKTRRVIKAAFAMRRKTLLNNLTAGLNTTRAAAGQALAACNIKPDARGETLSPEKFAELSQILIDIGSI